MTAQQHLFLARHGRTALNAEGRLRGLADPPLDPVGEAEAMRLAQSLVGCGAVLVVSSPLQRAVRTAEIIATTLGIERRVDQHLNDRDYGPQTGEIKEEVVARWGSVDAAPGVEPVATVLARVRPEIDALLDTPVSPGPGRAAGVPPAVIAVTHDAVIRPLIASIDPDVRVDAPTASYAELVRDGSRWSVLAVDRKPSV
ncbi:histidine phosphatase family protein [Tsukamurella soli]|uniref:Phosphoglycerate mutase n=1 Tax=Tsukamurella soli TaxID=644556 RepID=A0ABP8JM79_9ACTN